jgi:hypothetical protein
MGDRRQLDNRIKALHGQLEVAAKNGYDYLVQQLGAEIDHLEAELEFLANLWAAMIAEDAEGPGQAEARAKAILNLPGVQLTWDEWETDPDFETCPVCQFPIRFWYVTALDEDRYYVDSLTAHKCSKCSFKRFYLHD